MWRRAVLGRRGGQGRRGRGAGTGWLETGRGECGGALVWMRGDGGTSWEGVGREAGGWMRVVTRAGLAVAEVR
jgi:hypothetical protein